MSTHDTPPDELDRIRTAIDEVDRAIVDLIHDRLHLARRAFHTKRQVGLTLNDLPREAEVVRRASERARERGVESEHVREVFWRLISLSHHHTTGPAEPGP